MMEVQCLGSSLALFSVPAQMCPTRLTPRPREPNATATARSTRGPAHGLGTAGCLSIWAQPRDSSCQPRLGLSAQETRTLIWAHDTLTALNVVTCDMPSSVGVELLCKEGTADGLCCPRGWDTTVHCTYLIRVTRIQLCHSRCFSVSSFTPSSWGVAPLW